MEPSPDHRNYRFQSTPELVIDLTTMGIAELILLDDTMKMKQMTLTQDRVQVTFELDHRIIEG